MSHGHDWQRGKRISGGARKFVRYLKRRTHRAWRRTEQENITLHETTCAPKCKLDSWALY